MALRYSAKFQRFYTTKHICETAECQGGELELATVGMFRVEICSQCKKPMKEVMAHVRLQLWFMD